MTDETGGALSGPKEPNQEQRATGDNAQVASETQNHRPASAAAPQAPEETELARAERHREAERLHWRFEKKAGGTALILTAIAVVVAGASAIAAFQALTTAQQALIANERQSFANRAFLFMRYQYIPSDRTQWQQQPKGRPIHVNIGMCIENVGQSPAVITGRQFHLLLSAKEDSVPGPERLFQEDYMNPPTIDNGGLFEIGAVIPAAGKICPVTLQFAYLNARPTSLGLSKFNAYLEYRDVWQQARHSWYCADLGGTGASAGGPDCYHWD